MSLALGWFAAGEGEEAGLGKERSTPLEPFTVVAFQMGDTVMVVLFRHQPR